MTTAVIMLNFGEPEDATLETVIPYLERIFNLSRDLEEHATDAAARERSRRLAVARAPGLIEDYDAIGGSPLHRQAREQAAALEAALHARGLDAFVLLGMQFTTPSIDDAVAAAVARGATRIVGLPVYPLCGPTTTVAALATLRARVDAQAPDTPLSEIAGWHRHPDYVALRGRMIRETASAADANLHDPRTHLVFSAHGTPVKFLREGSRYEEYVEDSCAAVAREAGADRYTIGYQNHSNRPLEWTQPEVRSVIDGIHEGDVVVVDPISFMHEQSETLAELDRDLREYTEARGLRFLRVPIAHDAPAFTDVLADLVEPLVGGRDTIALRPCVCRATPHTFCLNGECASS